MLHEYKIFLREDWGYEAMYIVSNEDEALAQFREDNESLHGVPLSRLRKEYICVEYVDVL